MGLLGAEKHISLRQFLQNLTSILFQLKVQSYLTSISAPLSKKYERCLKKQNNQDRVSCSLMSLIQLFQREDQGAHQLQIEL